MSCLKSTAVLSKNAANAFSRTYSSGKLLPSMKEPFRVFPSEAYAAQPASFSAKTLASGTQVAVEHRPSQLFTTVSFFVKSGSRFETNATSGSSHLLKRLAFASTTNQTSFKIARELEAISANLTVSSGREVIQYSVDVLPENTEAAIRIVSEILQSPKFANHEVSDEVELIRQEVADLKATTPAAFLVDAAYSTAFSSESLGRPLIASDAALDSLDADVVRSFHSATFQPSRVVVVSRGPKNEEVFDAVEKHFGAANAGAAAAASATPKYYGGESRLSLPYGATEFTVSFRGVGLNSSDVYAQAVLKTILGGGKNYYTNEGPGYGSTSRINLNVVEANTGSVVSASAFQTPYSDVGVFGVHAVAKAGTGAGVSKALAQELKRAKAGDFSDEEIARAKAIVKAAVLFNSESSTSTASDIGVQLLHTKAYNTPAVVANKVEAVSAADVKKIAACVLSSPATLVTLGDSTGIPHPTEFLN